MNCKKAKIFSLTGLFLLISCQLLYSQQLPVGYIAYYSQKGNNPEFLKSLVINQPQGFEINKDKTYAVLNPFTVDTTGNSLAPACRGIVADKIFGEFIIEFDYKLQPGNLSNLSGFYFIGPVKSANTYYAIAFSDDSVSFFFADEGNVINLDNTGGIKMNSGWNKVRIKRDILNRNMQVTLNGDINHRTTFTDRNLVMGFIGFGTEDITSYLKNINIWAPTAFTDTLYSGE
jgi:hypothetical protein